MMINDDLSRVKTYIQKHHIMNHNNLTNQINHSSDSFQISELWLTTDFCDWSDFKNNLRN